MSDNQLLNLEQSPHLVNKSSTSHIMWEVCIALLPALVMAVINFGLPALIGVLNTVAATVAAEVVWQALTKRPISIKDGSAVVTGLLLSYSMPSAAPWWLYWVGGIFAIIVVKQLFGGLGHNVFNPAAMARVFLLVSFPVAMTNWAIPDVVTGASPLGLLQTGGAKAVAELNILDLALGYNNNLGCIGEISEIAILIGGIYLICRRIISWHIPVTFLGTVAIFAAITHAINPDQYASVAFHLTTGAVVLGAFFMATDYVTSPVTGLGKIIFGVGCGLITMIIRLWGAYPEGVSFAIVLMNAFTPLIDRYTRPKMYGHLATGLRRIFSSCKH